MVQVVLCSIFIYPKNVFFFTSFLLKLCFHEIGFSLYEIKTNCQLCFAASFLKDITNVAPKLCCQFSLPLSHYLLGDLDCGTVKKVFPDEKRRVLHGAVIPCFSETQQCYISSKMLGVLSDKENQILLCLAFFLHSINVKISEKLATGSSDILSDSEETFSQLYFFG